MGALLELPREQQPRRPPTCSRSSTSEFLRRFYRGGLARAASGDYPCALSLLTHRGRREEEEHAAKHHHHHREGDSRGAASDNGLVLQQTNRGLYFVRLAFDTPAGQAAGFVAHNLRRHKQLAVKFTSVLGILKGLKVRLRWDLCTCT